MATTPEELELRRAIEADDWAPERFDLMSFVAGILNVSSETQGTMQID